MTFLHSGYRNRVKAYALNPNTVAGAALD